MLAHSFLKKTNQVSIVLSLKIPVTFTAVRLRVQACNRITRKYVYDFCVLKNRSHVFAQLSIRKSVQLDVGK